MQVADAVHIGSGVEQQPHRFKRGTSCGEMERERVVTLVPSVRVSAVFEQKPDSVGPVHRQMQTGGARMALPNQIRLARQQFAQRREVAGPARREERLDRGHLRTLHGARLYPSRT